MIFTYALADRLAAAPGSRVAIRCLHPGCINTGVTQHLGIPSCVAPFQACYQDATHITAEEAAGHVVHLAISRDVDGAGPESRYFHLSAPCRSDPLTYDRDVRDAFWKLTLKALDGWMDKNATACAAVLQELYDRP